MLHSCVLCFCVYESFKKGFKFWRQESHEKKEKVKGNFLQKLFRSAQKCDSQNNFNFNNLEIKNKGTDQAPLLNNGDNTDEDINQSPPER